VVAGDLCEIHFPESDEDMAAFEAFLAQGDKFLALDTESTGLDIFSAQHQLRLVQVGNSREAWVLRWDRFKDWIRRLLGLRRNFIAHNATFDALTLDRHGAISIEELLPKIWDTKIMAHLLDPRGKMEGGIGLGLKELSAEHVDSQAPDTSNDLTKVFNGFGWTKAQGWARIPIEHMTYVLYAGLDVILCHRLHEKLLLAVQLYGDICKMEHKLQYFLALMRRRGMLLDIPYIERLTTDLHNQFVEQQDLAMDLGVESIFANEQVIAQLQAMGEKLTATTDKGALQVDRAVLLPLADVNTNWERLNVREPNPLAEAVLKGKRAKKWLEAYAMGFLEWRDTNDRIHPVINSLQARTARMSIQEPALQQLPSSDWTIRRAFIADPGFSMLAVDYKAVEMRVLAALSEDWTMRRAIADGEDLHSFTASRVFGTNFSKKQRKIAKSIGFGKVYGGGAAGVARLTGAPEDDIRIAMEAYDRTFPGIKRYSRKLIRQAQSGIMEVVTPIGRRLPLDPDRLYAATNYVVQSTARDLLAQAVIRLFEAGLGEYLLIPVHDEVVGQAPIESADEIAKEIGSVMESDFMGVRIESDPSVVGASWGAAYGAPAVLPMEVPVRKERRMKPGTWLQEALI
jgi:DNA polymerase-1